MAPIIDDDADELVRQVIAENPPEEQGIRDEWALKVGIHRKEDVNLRRRQPKKAAAPATLPTPQRLPPTNRSRTNATASLTPNTAVSDNLAFFLAGIGIVSLLMYVVSKQILPVVKKQRVN